MYKTQIRADIDNNIVVSIKELSKLSKEDYSTLVQRILLKGLEVIRDEYNNKVKDYKTYADKIDEVINYKEPEPVRINNTNTLDDDFNDDDFHVDTDDFDDEFNRLMESVEPQDGQAAQLP